MTQFLWAPCRKMSYPGFLPRPIWISLKYYCISSAFESSFMCINKDMDQTNTILLQINLYVSGAVLKQLTKSFS